MVIPTAAKASAAIDNKTEARCLRAGAVVSSFDRDLKVGGGVTDGSGSTSFAGKNSGGIRNSEGNTDPEDGYSISSATALVFLLRGRLVPLRAVAFLSRFFSGT